MTTSVLYLCPECGSPAVDVPVLAGSAYKCRSCSWTGQDALAAPYNNPYGNDEATFVAFANEFLETFAKSAALPLGKVLVKWGFVPMEQGRPHVQTLANYLQTMSKSMIVGLIRQCDKDRATPKDR